LRETLAVFTHAGLDGRHKDGHDGSRERD
jgi:hypothetical protein